MKRGFDSLSLVVEEEKHRNTIFIQTHCFLGGARPVPASTPGAKGLTYAWRPGKQEHPPLSRLAPGENTHQVGGFSCGTRTSFSFQGAVDLFSHRSQEVDMHKIKRLK